MTRHYGFATQEDLFLTLLLELGHPPPLPELHFNARTLSTTATKTVNGLGWVLSLPYNTKQECLEHRLAWDPDFKRYYDAVSDKLRGYDPKHIGFPGPVGTFLMRKLKPQVFEDFIKWVESRQ